MDVASIILNLSYFIHFVENTYLYSKLPIIFSQVSTSFSHYLENYQDIRKNIISNLPRKFQSI